MSTSDEQNAIAANHSNLDKLRRFLYLGDECHCFPRSVSYPFSPERAQLIKELEEARLASEALKEVQQAFKNGHYLGFETLIYVLAVFGHSPQYIIKREALKAASDICNSASMLLTFAHIYKDVSKPNKGWGRAHRRFLIRWYSEKDAKDLAAEVTKVKSCHKWTHKDVLCMAHVKAKQTDTAAVLKYLVKGLEAAEKDHGSESEAVPILNYLKGVYEVSHSSDPETVARLIEAHDLCLQHIPSKLLKTKEVSLCIIPRISIQNLLELLPQFNKAGLLKQNSPQSKAVLERLGSEEALENTTVGPLESFLAIRKWQISNKILPGKSMMRQSTPALDDALQNLHLASFKNVKTTDKRYLIALDINLTMNHSKCASGNALTPSHVSDVALLALLKAENSNVTTIVFSDGEVLPVEINHKMNLGDVVEHLTEITAGPVFLSAPLNWALTKKMRFDTFVIFTDRLSNTQDDDLAVVLKEYKETMHLPNARYILSTLCDRTSTFPHEDPSVLNIAGFSTKLLQIIQDFSCAVF